MAEIKDNNINIRCTKSGLATFNTAYAASSYKSKEAFILSLCQSKTTAKEPSPEEKDDTKGRRAELKIRLYASQKAEILQFFSHSREKRMVHFLLHALRKSKIEVHQGLDLNFKHELAINQIGNNLNQISKNANIKKDVDSKMRTLLMDIYNQLTQLNSVA